MENEWVEGSPLIASGWNINAQCHVVEIDPETYRCLCSSTSDCSNVHTYCGDCNELIEQKRLAGDISAFP